MKTDAMWKGNRYWLWVLLLLAGQAGLQAQDLTGTWQGDLSKNVVYNDIDRNYKMVWELVQVEREIYGIVYFYPQDTHTGDLPNAWYTWYGKQAKDHAFPFAFIQGRYIDGLGSSSVFQFNVKLDTTVQTPTLTGHWFTQLESLNTLERANGSFRMEQVSSRVSDRLWLKRKEKSIIEKLKTIGYQPAN